MKRIFNFGSLFLLLIFASACVTLQVSREVQSGRTALKLGKPKAALAHFEAAARLDPDYVTRFTLLDIGIWTYIGRAYYEISEKEKALAILNRAKNSFGDDYLARIYLGLVMSQNGSRREGMAELEAGLKGLAVWFEALPSRSPDGQRWGSNNYLADTISKTRNMLQAREPNWQGIAANVEWLGEELSKKDRAQSLFQRARYEFKYVD